MILLASAMSYIILQWVMWQKDVRASFALIVCSRNEMPDQMILKCDFLFKKHWCFILQLYWKVGRRHSIPHHWHQRTENLGFENDIWARIQKSLDSFHFTSIKKYLQLFEMLIPMCHILAVLLQMHGWMTLKLQVKVKGRCMRRPPSYLWSFVPNMERIHP